MASMSFMTIKTNEGCQFPERPTCIPQQFLTPARTPVVNVMVKPEPYDGKDSWEIYIIHFEDCAELDRWTDERRYYSLPCHKLARPSQDFLHEVVCIRT